MLDKKKMLSDNEKKAKMSAISEMRSMADDMLKDGLGKHMSGLKKVSVAAPDADSLKEGLEKAKEMLGSKSDDVDASDMHDEDEMSDDDMGSDEHEGEETPAEEESEIKDMDLSMDEIEEMERILQEKKQKLLSK